ncbi:MAG TPA: hypothetical protein DEO99_07420 [Bacteroidetes bacterium]|nr:hypothetical protein [Bacteroidota bacterium]
MVIQRIHSIYLGISTALLILFSATGEFSFAHFNGSLDRPVIVTLLSILVAALLVLTIFRGERPDIQYRMTTVILGLLIAICLVMLSLGLTTLSQSWINLSPLSGLVLILLSRRRINQTMHSQKRSDSFS